MTIKKNNPNGKHITISDKAGKSASTAYEITAALSNMPEKERKIIENTFDLLDREIGLVKNRAHSSGNEQYENDESMFKNDLSIQERLIQLQNFLESSGNITAKNKKIIKQHTKNALAQYLDYQQWIDDSKFSENSIEEINTNLDEIISRLDKINYDVIDNKLLSELENQYGELVSLVDDIDNIIEDFEKNALSGFAESEVSPHTTRLGKLELQQFKSEIVTAQNNIVEIGELITGIFSRITIAEDQKNRLVEICKLIESSENTVKVTALEHAVHLSRALASEYFVLKRLASKMPQSKFQFKSNRKTKTKGHVQFAEIAKAYHQQSINFYNQHSQQVEQIKTSDSQTGEDRAKQQSIYLDPSWITIDTAILKLERIYYNFLAIDPSQGQSAIFDLQKIKMELEYNCLDVIDKIKAHSFQSNLVQNASEQIKLLYSSTISEVIEVISENSTDYNHLITRSTSRTLSEDDIRALADIEHILLEIEEFDCTENSETSTSKQNTSSLAFKVKQQRQVVALYEKKLSLLSSLSKNLKKLSQDGLNEYNNSEFNQDTIDKMIQATKQSLSLENSSLSKLRDQSSRAELHKQLAQQQKRATDYKVRKQKNIQLKPMQNNRKHKKS